MARTGSHEEYERLWRTMDFLSGWEVKAAAQARAIAINRQRYQAVQERTGIPWPVIAAIHWLEAAGRFDSCLHNGERIIGTGQKTRLVPSGRGPFSTWEAAAADALGKRDTSAWGIGAIAAYLERYNGGGYLRRGVNSPYLWSGSNHGVGVGKYTSDGVYSATAVSQQVGAMLILRALELLGVWQSSRPKDTDLVATVNPEPKQTSFADNDAAPDLPLRIGQKSANVHLLQGFLNLALQGTDYQRLVLDGSFGPKTAVAFAAVTGLKPLPALEG